MKRKIVIGLLVVSCAALLSTGCSFKSIKHGTEITESQMSKIVDGTTTKQDVFVEFGNPSRTMDNEKVFFYNWTRGSKNSILGLGGGSAYTHSLVIVFNDNGVVKSHRITRGATEAGVNVTD
jgi:outer membrane protein assembly factor BamE (lipoprotein component of BamABCDE complex)